MKLGKKFSIGIMCLIISGLCLGANPGDPPSDNYVNGVRCNYWYTKFDTAGYSDGIYWGYSPYHPHDEYHELLSGEWGAAIYYDGIATEPNAMWLTDYFLAPTWPTYNNFVIDTVCSRWNDPQNPVSGYDTGQSVIKNSEVEVTIDYEIADLGENQFSPLVYREPNGIIRAKKSERYVLLQTYTIKNIKTSGNVTGLEFYQMLHGHGADEYQPVVYCCYEMAWYPDALEDYTPYNPMHTVGSFKYDITQWNNMDDPLAEETHEDWVGFSCTIEPDAYECGYFEGDSGKPETGTHISIEERNLDSSDYSYGETAGALGWYLPDLGQDDSVSITVAFMFGTGPTVATPPLVLSKTAAIENDYDCVSPVDPNRDEITYTISYSYADDPNLPDIDDVVITDYLPAEVDFNWASDPNMTYNVLANTVTWQIGTLSRGDSNSVTLKVKVNELAEPLGTITNYCEIEGDQYCSFATSDTDTCWWVDVIYADEDANGCNCGTSWQNAYNDLQDALADVRSRSSTEAIIYVAAVYW